MSAKLWKICEVFERTLDIYVYMYFNTEATDLRFGFSVYVGIGRFETPGPSIFRNFLGEKCLGNYRKFAKFLEGY